MTGGIPADAAGSLLFWGAGIMNRFTKKTAVVAGFLATILLTVPSALAQLAPVTPPFAVAPIDDGSLKTVAGREDTQQVATANQVAGVSQNSVGDNAHTGDAKIADNAFQNLSGLSILNINTGNNVAINAAMNVNISIEPPRP